MAPNVRFFLGTRKQYNELTQYNPLALYFCQDTGELFRGSQCLTAGVRLVAELPEPTTAATGILYYTDNKEGFVVNSDRTDWLKIIYAGTDDKDIDLSGYYTRAEADNAIKAAIENVEIPTVADFIEAIPQEYITESDLAAKGYITDISGKADKEHNHDKLYDASGAAAAAALAVKNDLLNGAGEAYDTLKELGDLIKNNVDAIDALEIIATGKADKDHTHKEYLTEHQSLSDYVKKEDLPAVPTKTSQLVNDSKFITAIPAEYVTETELNNKGYLTQHQDISNKADKNHKHVLSDITDYATPELPSLEEYATKQFVRDALSNITIPDGNLDNYHTKHEISDLLLEKADNVPFKEAKVVNIPVGSFVKGDSVEGLTIAQILAKLLGLSDPVVEPENESLVEKFLVNRTPMYSITKNGKLAEIEFIEIDGNDAPTASGFFTIRDNNGNIIKAGYQDCSAINDEMYYIIALPAELDYNTMVSVEAWDADESTWIEADMAMISDQSTIAGMCDGLDVDLAGVNTELFKIWLCDDICTGRILRYVIKETR